MKVAYIVSRVLQLVPTVVGAVSLVFIILRLAPGDPIQFLLGQTGESINPALVRMLREHYGLDRPFLYQYFRYLRNALTGDLGVSIHSNVPIATTILSQVTPTIQLAAGGMIVAIVLGVPLGVLAAVKRNTFVDYTIMTGAVIGISSPPFWIGILLIYFLGYRYSLFPMFGSGSGGWLASLPYVVLPSIAVGVRSLALLARITRSSVLDVLRQDFIRTAHAKGLADATILGRHTIKNAALTIVSVIGIDTAYLLGGTVTLELVFSRPGIGRLMVEGIFSRDYPMVQGCIIVFTFGVVLVNMLTDVAYTLLDPRVTYA
jgi:ABC-type dipeptide/oligopeptide/nickel transport system permease component